MGKIDFYIQPNLSLFENIEDLDKEKPSTQYRWWVAKEKLMVHNLYNHNRIIILGEPGYGKTELLTKLIEESKGNVFNGIMVDLKSLDLTKGIAENISLKSKRPDVNKTEGFCLNNLSNIFVCLDALDEVSSNTISTTLEKIKDFLNDYPLVKVFISCRTLHFKNFRNDFNGYKFKFLEISCFIDSQIYDYLEKFGIVEEDRNFILNRFRNTGKISVIQTPRYLNLLVKYIKEKGIQNIESINRCHLFEYFVYHKLDKEKHVLGKVDIELVKRVLETLALIMEIYQVNKLSKEDLITFFKDIQNDLKINILSQISIEEFIDKSILKNNMTEIEFDNTEFQEYLAAKEISRFSKLNQTVFDLTVNQKLREIYPSWFNVLSYILEMNIDLLEDILNFGLNEGKTIIDSYFSLITDVNVNNLNYVTKHKIFDMVFEYHQYNKLTLDPRICRNLSCYYTTEHTAILLKYLDLKYINKYQEHILTRNVFNLLFEILKRGYLNDEDKVFWNERYIQYLLNKNVTLNLKLQILHLTEFLKDKRILKILDEFSELCEKDDFHSILNSSIDVDVNNEITLKLIMKAIRNNSSSSLYSVFDLSSSQLIKGFFKSLIENDPLLDQFYETNSHIKKDKSLKRFIEEIRKLIDNELTYLLKTFIVNSYKSGNYWAEHSVFLKEIINLTSSIDNMVIFEFIDIFSREEDLHYFMLIDLFSICLHLEQIDEFVKIMKIKFPDKEWLTFQTLLYSSKYTGKKNQNEFIVSCKKYFEEEYKIAMDNQGKYEEDEEKENIKGYQNFKEYLEISTEKKYYMNIFNFYAYGVKNIDKYITAKELEKFKIILNIFLKSFDPSASGLKINKVEKGTTNYTVNQEIIYYGDAIICAELLNLNIYSYRQNLINYIPFAYSNHLHSIFTLVGNISTLEAKQVIEIYKLRKDDLWRFMPENFFQFIEKYNLKESLRILEEMFNLPDLVYDNNRNINRTKILEMIDNFRNDLEYLKSIFSKCGESEEEKILAEYTNKILITKYQDEEAVIWRLNKIVGRAFKFYYTTGAHGVGPEENELSSKPFAGPLMNINSIKFKDIYLNLIEESYKLQNKDDGYENYAHYLREITISYFFNLRIYKDYSLLIELEDKTKTFRNEKGYGWFLDRIRWLKSQYLEYIGKPDNISDCIRTYNRIKNKDYVDIGDSNDLFNLLKSIFNTDFNNWLKDEGRKIWEKMSQKERASETELQKLLKMEIENILHYKGLRPLDIHIYRESQLLDDKRSDFLVGYGFVNPILIELKLSDHPDLEGDCLESKDSYKNFNQYIRDFKSDYSIFLVIENQERKNEIVKNHFSKIESVYGKIKNVSVIGIPIV